MRVIEFRAKDLQGTWRYGDLITSASDEDFYKIADSKKSSNVDEATIGQFTGVYDKNGKKIFEGDILHAVNSMDEESEWITQVYDYGEIEVCGREYDITMIPYADYWLEFEIVGNIYDNPELIKKH